MPELFDLTKARKAGLSDQQIAELLVAAQRDDKRDLRIPESQMDEAFKAALISAGSARVGTQSPLPASEVGGPAATQQRALRALPYAAAMGAASIPIPGRIATLASPLLAAAAGALGKAGEMKLSGRQPTIEAMGGEAVEQGFLQAIPSTLFRGGGQALVALRERGRRKAIEKAQTEVRNRAAALEPFQAQIRSAQDAATLETHAASQAEQAATASQLHRSGQATARELKAQLAVEARKAALAAFQSGVKARDISAPLSLLSKEAQLGRAAAGRDVLEAASQAGKEGVRITVKDISDAYIRQLEDISPNPITDAAKARIAGFVRVQIRRIIGSDPILSVQLQNPKKLVFDPIEAQILKRHLGILSKTPVEQLAKGTLPKPSVVMNLTKSLKTLMEEKVPNIATLNKASQTALLKARALQTAEQALTHPSVAGVKTEAAQANLERRLAIMEQKAEQALTSRQAAEAKTFQERLATSQAASTRKLQERLRIQAEKDQAIRKIELARNLEEAKQDVLARRSGSPLVLYRGIPVRGGLAMPGVSLREGMVGELGGKIGQVLQHPASRWTAFTLPRLAWLYGDLLEPAEPDVTRRPR